MTFAQQTPNPIEIMDLIVSAAPGASNMTKDTLNCRPGCGACCIAPSISSLAKPAGQPCRHLSSDFRCLIFGQAERPACCSGLQPARDMCGDSREEALRWLAQLEVATRPAG